MCVGICTDMCRCKYRQEEGIMSPGAGVPGDSELQELAAGKHTRVLCQSSKLLTTKPSLSPRLHRTLNTQFCSHWRPQGLMDFFFLTIVEIIMSGAPCEQVSCFEPRPQYQYGKKPSEAFSGSGTWMARLFVFVFDSCSELWTLVCAKTLNKQSSWHLTQTLSKSPGAGEMAQLVKNLLWKHKNLSFIPRIHTEKKRTVRFLFLIKLFFIHYEMFKNNRTGHSCSSWIPVLQR